MEGEIVRGDTRYYISIISVKRRPFTEGDDETNSSLHYGTSENAVRTQIWIAISVYVLVAIIKKKLRLNVSPHTLLQILSLTLFEKLPLKQAVAGVEPIETNPAFYRQLNLFGF
jgi:hypothetical protein